MSQRIDLLNELLSALSQRVTLANQREAALTAKYNDLASLASAQASQIADLQAQLSAVVAPEATAAELDAVSTALTNIINELPAPEAAAV